MTVKYDDQDHVVNQIRERIAPPQDYFDNSLYNVPRQEPPVAAASAAAA